MTTSSHIYHLVEETRWRDAGAEHYRPSTYATDGFIHATRDARLLIPVANHFYAGVPGKFLCLRIDVNLLKSEVKYEGAAPVGDKPAYTNARSVAETSGQQEQERHQKQDELVYPHIYGPINATAVVAELEVTRSEDGTFLSIEEL